MELATLGSFAIVALIGVALVFDLMNGLHDAANSIATVVSTRVLKPRTAVMWAAFFNFIAFAVFGLHVANTIGTGIVDANIIDAHVIFGALTGAIAWNAFTWALGLPSSSSHALIGGLAGAGVESGMGCRRVRRARQDGARHRALAAAGLRSRATHCGGRAVGEHPLDAVRRRPALSRAATHFGRPVFT